MAEWKRLAGGFIGLVLVIAIVLASQGEGVGTATLKALLCAAIGMVLLSPAAVWRSVTRLGRSPANRATVTAGRTPATAPSTAPTAGA